MLLIALGIALASSASVTDTVADVGRTATFSGSLGSAVRGALFVGLGSLIALVAAFMLYRRIAIGARYAQGHVGVVESLSRRQARSSGLRVVAIGGGTGLSTTLRGLKVLTDNITAVVTVADDGGSSGRLREALGISPPGDARQCLIALSESEPLMERALAYRFETGGSLEGHNLGNLLIAALVHTEGSFDRALAATGELLIVHGRVVPSTLESNMHLRAETSTGELLDGETAIGHSNAKIKRIWLEPSSAEANPAVLEAVAQADVIVIGPGSLYTSILPNFLVKGMSEAVQQSGAPKLFVCNVATQHGETDGMTSADHLRIFERHTGVSATYFLMNDNLHHIEAASLQQAVQPAMDLPESSAKLVMRDLVDESLATRHDSAKLARAIQELARA